MLTIFSHKLRRPAMAACLAALCLAAPTFAQNVRTPFGDALTVERGSLNTPLVINQPGVYTLRRDIVVAGGDAVTINVSGVTFDLNGHLVTSLAGHSGRGIVINNVANIVVRNGKIKDFVTNVEVKDAANVTLDHLQIATDGDFRTCASTMQYGINVINARGVVIRDNNITECKIGIRMGGAGAQGNRLFHNTIGGTGDPAHSVAGLVYDGASGDDIYGNHIARFPIAVTLSAGTHGNVFHNNTLAAYTAAWRGFVAVSADGNGGNTATGNFESLIPSTVLPQPER